MQEIGILVGSDQSQEWLFDWFYEHLHQDNPNIPIAFVDFGMSSWGRNWCKQRGFLLDLCAPATPVSILGKEPLLARSFKKKKLKKRGSFFEGDFWQEWRFDPSQLPKERVVCFQKPLAISLSPFKKTLWLDLDCQVRGSLLSLFSFPLVQGGMGLSPCGSFCSIHNLSKKQVFMVRKYNTGVILVEKNSSLLADWARLSCQSFSFRTDEGPLSFLIDRKQAPITEISHRYNWPIGNWGENEEALIYHWLGWEAKAKLKSLILDSK